MKTKVAFCVLFYVMLFFHIMYLYGVHVRKINIERVQISNEKKQNLKSQKSEYVGYIIIREELKQEKPSAIFVTCVCVCKYVKKQTNDQRQSRKKFKEKKREKKRDEDIQVSMKLIFLVRYNFFGFILFYTNSRQAITKS